MLDGGRDDARARRHLGDDLDILLQRKERDQSLAEDAHVLRHQDADDRARSCRLLTHDSSLGRRPRRQ